MKIRAKNIILGLLVMLLCIPFTCTLTLAYGQEQSALYTLEKAGANEYAYNSLNKTQQRFFMEIGEGIEEFLASDKYKSDITDETNEIFISFDMYLGESMSVDDILNTVSRFQYANPKYYWLDGNFTYGFMGTGCLIKLKVASDYMTYASRKAVDNAIDAKLSKWVEKISKEAEKDVYFAALTAHDLIINSVDYAEDSYGNASTELFAHSIAGVFTGQGAVCEGYSKTFEYLLDLAGIPNIFIIGDGKRAPHAWNAVYYKDEWYLCDVTWDDLNVKDSYGFNNAVYVYFFMPAGLFGKTHTPYSANEYECYSLPKFADNMDETYFARFKCYSSTGISEGQARAFVNDALANRYTGSEYIDAVFASGYEKDFLTYVMPLFTGGKTVGTLDYYRTEYGTMVRVPVPVINSPSSTIRLNKESVMLGIGSGTEIIAELSENSDDRVIWELSLSDSFAGRPIKNYINMTLNGDKVVIKGLKSCKAVLKATVYSSRSGSADGVISASCGITIGTGLPTIDATVWVNGTKEYKTAVIKPKITATSWIDTKGNTKAGKLVWLISDTVIEPSFNPEVHTVSANGAKAKNASVSAKGVVTAKNPGKAYIYVCDTGSMKYEEFEVDVLGAPSKLYFTELAGSSDKEDIIKKYGIDAGSSDIIYITPYIKEGKIDPACTYTLSLAKSEQSKYLFLGEVQKDENGNPFFSFEALDFDRTKKKPISVKIVAVCKESGKKATMTVVIGNPVSGAVLEPVNVTGTLCIKEKKDTLTFKLKLETCLDGVDITTDKIKIYVGKTEVSLDPDDKVVYDKGATVKAKFDSKTMTVTLTANKAAGEPAVVAAAIKNSVNKEVFLIELARIDTEGYVIISQR